MDARLVAEEETELGAQLVQLARIARDHEIGPCIRLDGFRDGEAARRAIELVPALAGPGRQEEAGGAGVALRKRGSLPFGAAHANYPKEWSREWDGMREV